MQFLLQVHGGQSRKQLVIVKDNQNNLKRKAKLGEDDNMR